MTAPFPSHWCLQKYKSSIDLLEDDFPTTFNKLLAARGIPSNPPTSSVRTWVDWSAVHPHHAVPFYVEGAEAPIRDGLSRSALMASSHVIIEYGYDAPMIRIPTRVFVENWAEFAFSLELGGVVLAEHGSCYMEFTCDDDYLLHSNFVILPESHP